MLFSQATLHEQVTIVGCVTVLLVHLAIAISTGSLVRCLRLCRRGVERCWAALRAWNVRGAASNEIGCVVAKKLRKFRATQFQWFVGVGFAVAPIYFANVLLKTGTEREHDATMVQDVVTFLAYLIVLLLQWRPSFLKSGSVELWYSTFMAMMCVQLAPYACTDSNFPRANARIKIMVCSMSLMHLHTPLVVAWSAAMALVCAARPVLAAEGAALGATLLREGFYALLLGSLVHLLEAQVAASFRKDLEARAVLQRQSAAQALLTAFYDVVVELDDALRITAPAAGFAGFLLCRHSLEGMDFLDFMPREDDKQLFRERLLQPCQSHVLDTMRVALRDADGNNLEVEAVVFQFECNGDRIHQLLGLRELGDLREPPGGGNEAVQRERACQGGGAERTPTQGEAAHPFAEGGATVEVDLDSPELLMLHHSVGFTQLVGLNTPSGGLLSLVPEARRAAFRRWVENSVNSMLYGEPVAQCELVVTLQAHPGVPKIRAVCRILGLDEQSDGSAGGQAMPSCWLAFALREAAGGNPEDRDGGSSGGTSSSAGSRRNSGSRRHCGTERQVGGKHTGSIAPLPSALGKSFMSL